MKKSVFRRFIKLSFVYAAAVFLLAVIQFRARDGFDRNIGSLVVTGKYKNGSGERNVRADGAESRSYEEISAAEDADNGANDADSGTDEETGAADGEEIAADEEYIDIEEEVNLFFQGLEFPLGAKEDGGGKLAVISNDGIRSLPVPVKMKIADGSARFILSDGEELLFYTRDAAGEDSLLISANFADDTTFLELPYRLTRNARVDEGNNADFAVVLNKKTYTFDSQAVDNERGVITLSRKNPVVTYRIVPAENDSFNLSDFIISGMTERRSFNSSVYQWCAQAMAEWEKSAGSSADEDVIIAYIAESARLKNYSRALSKVPPEFYGSDSRTFRSAPYTGRLEFALQSLAAYEKRRKDEIKALIAGNPGGLLNDIDTFKYLVQRGENSLFEQALAYVKTLGADSVEIEQVPGILAGWWVFNTWRPKQDNPFGVLSEKALAIVSGGLKKDMEDGRVFFARNGNVDVLYNLMLGIALQNFGEAYAGREWAAIGRSIIFSVLGFADNAGSVCGALVFPGDGSPKTGSFREAEGTARIKAGEIYGILQPSDYYPHATGASSVMLGVWVWTASPRVGASYMNNVLELNITFTPGESHYMIIRGIRPFSKIQMRGMDYRTDPKYESYNSPGWAYSQEEQSLMVKLAHRTEVETIKIFF